MFFRKTLDGKANVAQLRPRFNRRNAKIKALLTGLNQALAANRAVAHNKGFAGIAMKTIFD